jgi:glutaredoxin 2
MSSPLLELYYFDACPYCQKVLKVINELNILVHYKDISKNSDDHKKLVTITGRQTVPCLFIDGKPMHESLDIMNWLKENSNTLIKK